jgi:hypothetical protein
MNSIYENKTVNIFQSGNIIATASNPIEQKSLSSFVRFDCSIIFLSNNICLKYAESLHN